MHEDAAPRDLIPYWRRALDLLRVVLLIFGPPSDIAARRVGAETRARLSRWLRQLEAALRALIEAWAAILPETKSRPRRGVRSQPRDAGASVANPDSKTWRVVFRAAPRACELRGSARKHRRAIASRRIVTAMPLAERLEAAIRVLAAPELYARRRAASLRKARAKPIAARRTSLRVFTFEPAPRAASPPASSRLQKAPP